MHAFDLQRMALDETTPAFLAEVAARCLFTFVLVFIFLKMTGRRGVRQMSLFEVLIILTLGSAAGDVAFYHDVPLLPVLAVFISIMVLYRLATWLMDRFETLQTWMEGKPLILVSHGIFDWDTLQRENITHDEFFMELRLVGVEHLGQVRLAILEVNGAISVYFYADDEVRPGLPVLPVQCVKSLPQAEAAGDYTCSTCSLIAPLADSQQHICPRCGNGRWIAALSHSRVS
ncbi:DUF421 domain-containing protein [Serratia plymuthica]|uniref:DUF421 domain-containing protein n=1 Tax=Serratia plymuthica TaxID=82996 RepID=UPI000937E5F2|nr:DUF421 domain-containing protein [Serratia plymuthica]OJT43679.1 hypothetical protein BSR04_06530 [Serratia plymuthica]